MEPKPSNPSNRIIQGLWIGPELSVMERLSIASFLAKGHDYHLYVYDEVKHVPAGTTLQDAAAILPSSEVFQYSGRPSYAGFSNFFRYKLLLERGGWWADTDIVCLEPFDFSDDYVFSSEMSKGVQVVTSGVIKSPAGSEAMSYSWEVCRIKNREQLVWGETGPKLMAEVVQRFSLERYTQPYDVFCPLGFFDWRRLVEPEPDGLLNSGSHAIHLWNEKWREANQDKNARYPENSVYEQLKNKYL